MSFTSSVAPDTRCYELLKLYRPETWGHFAQFYDDDKSVIEGVAHLAARTLTIGDSSVLIATSSHLRRIESRLTSYGLDLDRLCNAERYIACDAQQILPRVMVNNWPDDDKFNAVVGGFISKLAKKSANQFTFAFGEMVALLCAENKMEAALRIEQLWNSLCQTHHISLCCAYPLNAFINAADVSIFVKICAEHSLVIPSEAVSVSQ